MFDVSTGKAISVRGWTRMTSRTGFGDGIVRFGATIIRELGHDYGQDPGVGEEGRGRLRGRTNAKRMAVG